MPWRVIARIGFTSDDRSVMRNSVTDHLKEAGFERSKTGTWETASMDESEAAEVLVQVLRTCSDPSGISGLAPGAHLKHLWLYIDQLDDEEAEDDDIDIETKAEMHGYDRREGNEK